MSTESANQLQAMIDLVGKLKIKHLNIIYESLGLWAEDKGYPDETTSEWMMMSRYQQASQYIAWMEERFKS